MPSFVQLFRYNFVPGAKMSCIKCIITRATFSSPVGKLDVQVCDSGLHEFSFSKETNNNNFLDEGSSAIDLLSSSSANKQVSHIHDWLKNYSGQDDTEDINGVEYGWMRAFGGVSNV